MDEVELMPMSGKEFERIAPVEFLAAIMRLLSDVHADDVESCQLIASRGAAGTTEEVERDQHEALTTPTA